MGLKLQQKTMHETDTETPNDSSEALSQMHMVDRLPPPPHTLTFNTNVFAKNDLFFSIHLVVFTDLANVSQLFTYDENNFVPKSFTMFINLTFVSLLFGAGSVG